MQPPAVMNTPTFLLHFTNDTGPNGSNSDDKNFVGFMTLKKWIYFVAVPFAMTPSGKNALWATVHHVNNMEVAVPWICHYAKIALLTGADPVVLVCSSFYSFYRGANHWQTKIFRITGLLLLF